MLKVRVTSDISKIIAKLGAAREQIPFATALALTRTAQYARDVLRAQMSSIFSNPTPYTLNSMYVRPAQKKKLPMEASVEIKDEQFKGAAPVRWLRPQVYGGDRDVKRLEQRLRSAGVLPNGMFVVPGKGAAMDAYGNMSRGQIQQVLSALRAQNDPLQNTTAASLKRRTKRKQAAPTKYFTISKRHGKLMPGIYARNGRTAVPIMIFVKQPHYKKRFNFYEIGTKAARERFAIEFERAVSVAIKSMR